MDSVSRPWKVVHFIRHGEASHNVAFKYAKDETKTLLDWKYLDPELTKKGRAQSAAVKYQLLQESHPEVVFVSPLTRTLQTATEFYTHFPSPTYVVHEDVREHYGQLPCDKRRSTKVLQKEFPHFDLSTISEEDVLWTEERETTEQLQERARRVIDYILNSRTEQCIAVFTHNGFLKALLSVLKQDYGLETQGTSLHFKNGELRTIIFEKDGKARLAMQTSGEDGRTRSITERMRESQ